MTSITERELRTRYSGGFSPAHRRLFLQGYDDGQQGRPINDSPAWGEATRQAYKRGYGAGYDIHYRKTLSRP
jgi:hypothetical protein